MLDKRSSSANESNIDNSEIDVGNDFVVGGKGNQTTNNYINFSFPWWLSVGLILVVVIIGIIQFLPQQDATTMTPQQERSEIQAPDSTLTPPLTDKTLSDTETLEASPTAKKKTPPATREIKPSVNVALTTNNEDYRQLTLASLNQVLTRDGYDLLDIPDAKHTLTCDLNVDIQEKQMVGMIYLIDFTLSLTLSNRSNEQVVKSFIFSTADGGEGPITLTSKAAIPGTFQKWLSKQLQEANFRS